MPGCGLSTNSSRVIEDSAFSWIGLPTGIAPRIFPFLFFSLGVLEVTGATTQGCLHFHILVLRLSGHGGKFMC